VEYTSEAVKGLGQIIKDGAQGAGKFSIEILNGDGSPSEMGSPPVLDIVRAMSESDTMNVSVTERLAKYCLMYKVTVVKYDNKEVGRFVVNDMDMAWDSFDVIRQYPLALLFIINACAGEVIKKLIPPRVKEVLSAPEAAAGLSTKE
jgi:hypothetical protein